MLSPLGARVLLALGAVLTTLLLIEGGLYLYEFYLRSRGETLTPWADRAQGEFIPSPHHMFIPAPNSESAVWGHRVNSLGFRAPEITEKPEGTARILTIGDSTVFGFAVPEKTEWPARLFAHLREAEGLPPVQIYNHGVIGSTLWGNLQDLKIHGDDVDPDFLILSVGGWNDYQVHDVGRQYTDIDVADPEFKKRQIDDANTQEIQFGRALKDAFLDSVKWTMTYKFWRRLEFQAEAQAQIQRTEDRIAAGIFTPEVADEPRRVPLPIFRECLHEVLDWAEERDVEVIFCEQILRPSDRPDYPIIESYVQAVREIAAERGAHFVETGSALDAAAQGKPEHEYWIDWIHPTPEGYRVWAEKLAEEVIPLVRDWEPCEESADQVAATATGE